MITVRIIRVFDGPRHDLLRSLWECIAEYARDQMILKWFPNDRGWDHTECLNRIWTEEQQSPSSRLLITEHDFLPDLNYDDWLLQKDLKAPDVALAAACYSKRAPGTRTLANFRDIVGPWLMSFDKTKCPGHLEFRGRLDPGGALCSQLLKVNQCAILYPGHDPYPLHVGVEYAFGTHLFWSRHYNDPPETRVSGYNVGEILIKHDRCVYSWILQQPQEFQALLVKRLGSTILESSSEYIAARSIYTVSPGKFNSSAIVEEPA